MKGRYLLIGIAFLLVAAVLLVRIGDIQATQAAAPAPICLEALQEDPPTSTMYMPYQLSPCGGSAVETPFYEEWLYSKHNAYEDEAFRHWDDDGEIEVDCAKCHSTPGYQDYIGADGTPPNSGNVTDNPAELGTTIECVACHNDVTLTKTSVEFPSTVIIEHLGDESSCMECHQGNQSGPDVAKAIEDEGLTDDVDTVSADLEFLNIHYYAAASTQYGNLVYGGFQYYPMEPEGGPYDVNFRHVVEYDQCYECHDMHTLELKLDECAECHVGVETKLDLRDVRMLGSLADYDGDGDMEEGIYYEVDGLKTMLYVVIQQYGNQISGQAICYESHAYPYWFNDNDASGTCEPGEAIYPNKYESWTARLLKAAYNYQVVSKDPGGYTHGGKYLIQLMHDSIYDMNDSGIEPGMDMVMAHRDDPGHFAGSQEAWRHWDKDDHTVPSDCSRCHRAEGIPLLDSETSPSATPVNYVAIKQPAANGMMCTTCHDGANWPNRYEFPGATFPNGESVSLEKDGSYDNNLCIQCHQGRAWGGDVDEETEGIGDDVVDEDLDFNNVHYFAAGATLFGNVTNGIYEYAGMTYVGQNLHPSGTSMYATCTDCHATHELEVEWQSCNTCHAGTPLNGPEDLINIRWNSTPDYNGNGDTTEGVYYEIMGLADDVYAGMQAYATAHPDADDICYDSHSYPYWFKDTNGSGMCDPGEAIYPNSYKTWTPRLLRAGYNYQYALKDPGMYAHNNKYVGQALYDNLADMEASDYASGLTDGLIRPQ